MKYTQAEISAILEKRRKDAMGPDFCYTCNGSGAVRKPIEEWSDAEHEYNACPRVNGPSKVCPDCGGKGLIQ